MDILGAIILALVQAITEWIPISSTSHLVIISELFNLNSTPFYDALLHLGTFVSAVVVFREDILKIIRAVVTWNTKSSDFKLFWYVVVATIPIVLAGFLLKDFVEAAFSSLLVVGISLIVTAVVLYLTKYATQKTNVDMKNGFWIGLSQIFALLPGISRSGMTISVALLLGIKREQAAKFSFLLFLPAVLGAGVLQLLTADLSSIDITSSILGVIISAGVGIIALKWLLKVVKQGNFHNFSWYCLALGIVVLTLGA